MPYLVTADTPGRVHTATIALSGSLSGAVAIPSPIPWSAS